MVRSRRKHGLVGLNRVLELVLLDVTLRAIQLFDDIHAHEGSNRFPCEIMTTDMRAGRNKTKKHYILSRLHAPNRSHCPVPFNNSVRACGCCGAGGLLSERRYLWHTECFCRG